MSSVSPLVSFVLGAAMATVCVLFFMSATPARRLVDISAFTSAAPDNLTGIASSVSDSDSDAAVADSAAALASTATLAPAPAPVQVRTHARTRVRRLPFASRNNFVGGFSFDSTVIGRSILVAYVFVLLKAVMLSDHRTERSSHQSIISIFGGIGGGGLHDCICSLFPPISSVI